MVEGPGSVVDEENTGAEDLLRLDGNEHRDRHCTPVIVDVVTGRELERTWLAVTNAHLFVQKKPD
ncbi:hypothetical protein M404DRAFT_991419 [Pisolithus tinctorius Marx 270]|uniref:Uncharacterized protein n=1 Tax=Pisolithus tinctorius Marx 270 TaxID=870435 RepID=A0A0C3PYE8_PISTI|nr:hypothetical protein M404DRAFT_991419 [Pisolithus tinctorius Marx 270]